MLVSVLGALVMATVVRFAWISDDALITARSVLNVLHGYGANFNIDERVQSYTHPLWFGIWTSLSFVSGEVILMPIAMGIVFAAVAVAIVCWVSTDNIRATVALLGLAISPMFIVWATSGLENALAMALIGVLWLMTRHDSARRMALFGVAVAASVLTRLDLAVLIAPLVVVMFWRAKGWRARAALLAGATVPVLAWLAIAYLYYGYAMPATFYAKTNVEIPRTTLVLQGLRYGVASVRTEPQAVVVFALGVLALATSRTRVACGWLAGVGLYLLYVIWVGGDFMEGRFLAVPFFVAVLGIATSLPIDLVPARARLGSVVALLGLLFIVGLSSNPVYWRGVQGSRWDERSMYGIADERGFYVGAQQYGFARWVVHQWGSSPATGVELLRTQASTNWSSSAVQQASEVRVVCGGLGGVGIAGGPRTHIIDPCGLADMYLAQTPYRVRNDLRWRPGHYDRVLPNGYEQSVRAGRNLVVDPVAARRLDAVWPRIDHRMEPVRAAAAG